MSAAWPTGSHGRDRTADVRVFGRRRPHRLTEAGTDVVTVVADELRIPAPVAAETVRSVAGELSELVPEAAAAISAVLPVDAGADGHQNLVT